LADAESVATTAPLVHARADREDTRRSFERGATATRPAHSRSEPQMTNLVRSSDGEGAFDAWVSSLRE
jgi:hypothetical protein